MLSSRRMQYWAKLISMQINSMAHTLLYLPISSGSQEPRGPSTATRTPQQHPVHPHLKVPHTQNLQHTPLRGPVGALHEDPWEQRRLPGALHDSPGELGCLGGCAWWGAEVLKVWQRWEYTSRDQYVLVSSRFWQYAWWEMEGRSEGKRKEV